MKLRLLIIVCLCVLAVSVNSGLSLADQDAQQKTTHIPYGLIEPSRISRAYAGTEKFRYSIAYTGGLKLGELDLEIRSITELADNYELYVLASTENSVFNVVYPLRDVYITRVSGQARLPYSYESWQKEGFGYEAHKITIYDQASGRIEHQRNDDKPESYQVTPPVHNEFSSFFASRLMPFTVGGSFLVPTFADKKRTDVEVKVLGKVHFKKTVLGPVDTFRVSPILPFKGLYDKRGDTVIWYTADACRVPVKITSKLAIGSITATLSSYENPLCDKYASTPK